MNKKLVTQWMKENYEDCMDWTCNVLNTTLLAETAADVFSLYENDQYDISEEVYDWAVDLEQELINQGVCQL